MRFGLTASRKGDAPHARALLEGLPADAVLAATASDSDQLQQIISAKDAVAVIPDNPWRAQNRSFVMPL